MITKSGRGHARKLINKTKMDITSLAECSSKSIGHPIRRNSQNNARVRTSLNVAPKLMNLNWALNNARALVVSSY